MQREVGRKHAKKGIAFNILICGSVGLGKSTFVRSLVGRDMTDAQPPTDDRQTIEIVKKTEEVELFDQKLILTVVDTPGFGGELDNSKHFQSILNYMEEQDQRFLDEESRMKRDPKFLDSRVHVVLYFISPSGHAYVIFAAFCWSI